MRVYVAGVGLLGPGLEGWAAGEAVLRGATAYAERPLELAAPTILSSRERRRCGPAICLALNAAEEAVQRSGLPAEELAAVFGSSAGSGLEIHQILEALTTPEMLVSPTQFHNSVHNAAVGYWCIATGCRQPSTSIASHDHTFPAALLKSAAEVATEGRQVLLAVFDYPFPAPLDGKRHIACPFAVALVLTPDRAPGSLFSLDVTWQSGPPEPAEAPPDTAALAPLWRGNPAGRALPLLEAIARRQAAGLTLHYPDSGGLKIVAAPC